MVKKVVVGAHYGLRDWLAQRVTAAVMALYVLLFVALLLAQPVMDHAAWKALFANQWMRLATMLFLLSLYYHAWIGVRDILMDYVQATGVRLTAQVLVILALVLFTVWSAQILWSL
ncbi:MAG TPA: succinate dehydrogenase, hydrophobic membrane anchor protein [Burkholderiales bacterium]|nr:succinate dehydrogenase, hydrophobic membrane anchor protein [Burkholderiales bacterium]